MINDAQSANRMGIARSNSEQYQRDSSTAAELPFVSIILPVRNEERTIAGTLDSLRGQKYPRNKTEIIVADGMSTDRTRQIVSLAASRDRRIRLVDNVRRIMPAGFNAALRVARGDVLLMMGGHTELSRNYLRVCSSLLRGGIADCVGGAMRTVGHTKTACAIALAMSSRFGVGGVAFRTGCAERKYVDTVAFGAYSREIIDRIGPLDEEFVRGQDDELNYRLRKLGGRILIVPELTSTYTSRSSLRSLARQYFQYGYWKVRLLQKHPRQMQIRHFVPGAFVGCLLLLLILAMGRPILGAAMICLVLGLYVTATAVTSASLAFTEKKWWLGPLLAITFPVLHFSYGTGFLSGLLKFWRRWNCDAKSVARSGPRSSPLGQSEG